jgi:hypothetical protein
LLRPKANRISAGDELGAQFNFAACAGYVIAQLVVDSARLGTSQHPGSDDRTQEERSEKSNHNNAKDKTLLVENRGGGGAGGQPVGDRSCETPRLPASASTFAPTWVKIS